MEDSIELDGGAEKAPIFISYADPDVESAKRFKLWFSETLQTKSFVANRNIRTGRDWREIILAAVENCSVGVVLVTSQSMYREWVQFEIGALSVFRKPIIPIRLKEAGVPPKNVMLATLERAHYRDWEDVASAHRITRDIAAELSSQLKRDVRFDPDGDEEICLEPIDRRITDAAFVQMLLEATEAIDHTPYVHGISWESHNLAPVFIEYLLRDLQRAAHGALGIDERLPLSSDIRRQVARKITELARTSIDAIAVVENDKWIFQHGATANAYVAANIQAASNISCQLRRIVVANDKELREAAWRLDQMTSGGIVIKRLRRDQLHDHNNDYLDKLENVLIADGQRMTESFGTAHAGYYTVSSRRINDAKRRFEMLWNEATPYASVTNGAPGGVTE